jgi:hypothetical protein
MRKQTYVLMTVMLLMLALATAAIAGDPFVGTWKTNIAKSKFIPGPPPAAGKGETVTITAQDNGIILVADGWYADGKPFHVTFAAKFDGKDYPYTGTSNADTVALKRINANSFDSVSKKGGKELGRNRTVISKDGKTMTRTIKGKNAEGQETINIRVYDKQ